MKWVYDIKIGARLIGAFIIVGAITAIVGYMGIRNMGNIAELTASSYAKETVAIVYIKQADVEIIHMARAEKNLLLSSTPEERTKYKAAIESFSAKVNEDVEKARPLVHTDEGKELMAKFDQTWKERQEVVAQIEALAGSEDLQKNRASVDLSMGLGREKADAVEGVLEQMGTLKEDNAKTDAQTADETYQSSRTMMIILVVGGVLTGVGLGIFISRSISKPLAELSEAAEQISQGDLTQAISYHSADEVGSLADSFRSLTDYIKAISGGLEKMAVGDLSTRIEAKSDRDVLTNNLNTLIVAMNGITSAAEEIANGNLTISIKERSPQDKLMQALAGMVEGLTRTVNVRSLSGLPRQTRRD